MELAPLLILPLVGGYAFSSIWNVSKYITYREDGQRLYFRAIFYAVFITIVSANIHTFLFVHINNYQIFLEYISLSLNYKDKLEFFSNTSRASILVMTIIIGPSLAHILNSPRYMFMGYKAQDSAKWLTNKFKFLVYISIIIEPIYKFFQAMVLLWEKFILDNAIKNNDFEKLMARSVYKSLPILITLESGKIYVGWAVRVPNPIHKRKSVRILPLLSGYRTSDTHEVVFTTSYHPVLTTVTNDTDNLNHLEHGDFEVVLPTSNICSCHLFDPVAYAHFHSNNSGINQQSTEEPNKSL